MSVYSCPGYPGAGCSLYSSIFWMRRLPHPVWADSPVLSAPQSKEINGFLESLDASMTLSPSSQICVTSTLAGGALYPSPRLVHQGTPHPGTSCFASALLQCPSFCFVGTSLLLHGDAGGDPTQSLLLILCSLCSSHPARGC